MTGVPNCLFVLPFLKATAHRCGRGSDFFFSFFLGGSGVIALLFAGLGRGVRVDFVRVNQRPTGFTLKRV